eukprot:643004-Heterocapsa_arctica.AAC.1
MAAIFNIDPTNANTDVLLMINSDACVSTCPLSWCDWAPLRAVEAMPQTVTATGAPLKVYGARKVRCTTWYGVAFDLSFIVSDVTWPIMAVADLLG